MILTPSRIPADTKPATNPGRSRPILGSSTEFLSLRRLDRPTDLADVEAPRQYLTGANSGETFLIPQEATDEQVLP